MKSLNVDFAPPPGPSRFLMALTLAMGVAAVVISVLGWKDWAESRRLYEQVEAQVAQAKTTAERAAAEMALAKKPEPALYATDAWAALQQQQFPLNAVLTAIETVAIVGVRVTSVDVVTSEAVVRLQVEFSDYETLMKYLQELNAGEPAERWVLVSAQINSGGTSGRPTANLLSTWRPPVHNPVAGR